MRGILMAKQMIIIILGTVTNGQEMFFILSYYKKK